MSLLALGAIVAGSVRRHGFFLLAPGAFARPILEALRDGVALLHPDGVIRTGNLAFSRLVGVAPAELAGAAVFEWLPGLSRDPVLESRGTELELRPHAAPPMPVSVSASPLRDEQGGVIGRVLAVRDLREVAALRNRLVTSGRLAAVGELAAGIAQEIDEPVTAVRANLSELGEQWRALASGVDTRDESLAPLLYEGAELIEESGEGIERVARIVKEVSAFSQADLDEPQLANVNDLLENAVNVAALSFSVVVERCYAELPPVRCDAQQLRQVFLNLLINALQAVGDFGVIRLLTDAQGDFVRIRVRGRRLRHSGGPDRADLRSFLHDPPDRHRRRPRPRPLLPDRPSPRRHDHRDLEGRRRHDVLHPSPGLDRAARDVVDPGPPE